MRDTTLKVNLFLVGLAFFLIPQLAMYKRRRSSHFLILYVTINIIKLI